MSAISVDLEVCDICLERTSNLKEHLKTEHFNEDEKNDQLVHLPDFIPSKASSSELKNEENFLCEQCGGTFTGKSTFLTHLLIHKERSPFSKPRVYCSICGIIYASQNNVDFHMKLVHQKEFKCSPCKQYFGTRVQLEKHKCTWTLIHRTKPELKPFKCDLCRLRFANSFHLKNHIEAAHTKRYQCHCGKIFTRKHDFAKHIQCTHEDNRLKLKRTPLRKDEMGDCTKNPLKCQFCPLSLFTTHRSLEMHIKNVHQKYRPLNLKCRQKKSVYSCEFCKGTFSEKDSLDNHTCSKEIKEEFVVVSEDD